jgi:hypothetical protein
VVSARSTSDPGAIKMPGWPSLPFSIRRLLRGGGADEALDQAPGFAPREAPIPEFRERLSYLQGEMDRARRYKRPLSVLVVTPHPVGDDDAWPGPIGDADAPSTDMRVLLETRLPQLASLLVGSILAGAVRQGDSVTYRTANDRFVVFLAEADREAARGAVRRIQRMMRERARLGMRVGIATFPEDGLTLSDLLGQAAEKWERTPFELHVRSDRNANEPREVDL